MTDDKTDRVMLDIETLGLEPGCAIVSIGAVEFDAGKIGGAFYGRVSLLSCDEHGLTIDGETLAWHLEQDDIVRDELIGGKPLSHVLEKFTGFCEGADEVWANAPSFDCAILAHAYDACGIDKPWEYYEERCFRTLKALPIAPEIEQDGEKHHALDDAKHQARIASEALARLDGVVVDA